MSTDRTLTSMRDAMIEARAKDMTLPLHIPIAGGPNAGKSTLMPLAAERFRHHGYRTIVMPEMATWLYTRGVADVGEIAQNRRDGYVGLQTVIGMGQRDLRRRIQAMLPRVSERSIILSDRGELDIFVYLEQAEAEGVLAAEGLTMSDLYDEFDEALYLATGAAHTDLGSNPARRETDAGAAELACQATWKVWGCHHGVHRVDASEDFGQKTRAMLDWIDDVAERDRTVGIPRLAAAHLSSRP